MLTLDRQPSGVAVENVLDQGEPEAGAALRAALGHVDPIEALGQPRQMLGAIPGPWSRTATCASPASTVSEIPGW